MKQGSYSVYKIYGSGMTRLLSEKKARNSRMNYYDHISQGYDELHRQEQIRKLEIIIPLLEDKQLNGKLLDVGSGTGFCLDILRQRLGLECWGIEPSQGMIAQYQGKEHLLLAEAEKIPFSDESFDAVVSLTAIQNFSNIAKGVIEMKRVAKEFAPIIISALKKSPRIKVISVALADHLMVDRIIEEEKDLIFVCRRT